MSGGHFDYKQYELQYIADAIEEIIRNNETDPRWGYSPSTLSEFQLALHWIKVVSIYTQRIDYLLCGDDSEESFHERLAEDWEELV